MCWQEVAGPVTVSTHCWAELALTAVWLAGDLGAPCRSPASVRQVEASGRNPASRETGTRWGARGTSFSCWPARGTAEGGRRRRRVVPGACGCRGLGRDP